MKDLIYLREPTISSLAYLLHEARSKPHAYELLHSDKGRALWAECQRTVAYLLGGPMVAQRVPTVRWFGADEPVPYGWHTDSDEGFGHPRPCYNLWAVVKPRLPAGVLSTEHESSRAMLPGDALLFQGSERHYAATIAARRVTFDARFVPRALFYDTGKRSDVAGVPLRIGDYYEVVEP